MVVVIVCHVASLVVGDASGEVVVTQIPIAGYLAVCFGSAFDLESGCCDTPSERVREIETTCLVASSSSRRSIVGVG